MISTTGTATTYASRTACSHRFLNRVITLFMYGLDTEKEGGFMMSHAMKAMDGFQQASVPGAFLVDIIPSRKSFRSFTHFTNLTKT